MIPTPVAKTCRGCGMTQPLDVHHFYPQRYRSKKGVEKINWKCKFCKNQSSNFANRKRRRDPERGPEMRARCNANHKRRYATPEGRERALETHRRWYRKLKADPERWQAYIVGRRIDRRARILVEQGRTPRVQASREPYKADIVSVPIGPFQEFLQHTFPGMGAGEIVDMVGEAISERRIRGVLNGTQDRIAIATVDAFLTKALDAPEILDELYPYEDA